MDDFNLYEEKEVLLEPVCNFEVLEAEKFDAGHRMVLMGEIKAGLHRVVGRVRPGVERDTKVRNLDVYRPLSRVHQKDVVGFDVTVHDAL